MIKGLRAMLERFAKDCRGVAAVDYALLAASFGILVTIAVTFFTQQLDQLNDMVIGALQNKTPKK